MSEESAAIVRDRVDQILTLPPAEAIEAVHRLATAIVSYARATLAVADAWKSVPGEANLWEEVELPPDVDAATQERDVLKCLVYGTVNAYPHQPSFDGPVSAVFSPDGIVVAGPPSEADKFAPMNAVACLANGIPAPIELRLAKANSTIASFGDVHATCFHRIPFAWLLWILTGTETVSRNLSGCTTADLSKLLAHLRREYLLAIEAAGGTPTQEEQLPRQRRAKAPGKTERDEWIRSPEACALPHKEVLRRIKETGWPELTSPGAITNIRDRG